MVHLHIYAVKLVDVGASKEPFLTQVSDFTVLFGSKLDAEVLSMPMDLFVAKTMITKASLVFQGFIDITENQLVSLKSFHVRPTSIVLDVDVERSSALWDSTKAYLFVPVVGGNCIDWGLVETIIGTDSWENSLQRAHPDVYLGTNELTLGGDRREYGYGKLCHDMAFGQKSHPTYDIDSATEVQNARGIMDLLAEMLSALDPGNKKRVLAKHESIASGASDGLEKSRTSVTAEKPKTLQSLVDIDDVVGTKDDTTHPYGRANSGASTSQPV